MDLRQLRYFVAIAEKGGFNAAAEVLHVAQSALSRHVRNLELECGGPLFERASRGLVLTKAGTLLLERARSLLRQADSLRVEVQAENDEPTGLVRFGTTPVIATTLFQPLAAYFLERYPKVRLQLVETITPGPLALLSRADLDLALTTPNDNFTSIEYEPLFVEQMCVFGPQAPERDQRPAVDGLEALLDVPLVVPVGAPWMPQLGALLGERVQRVQIRIEVVSMICLKQMVVAGLGRGVVPLWALSQEIEESRVWAIPIDGFFLTRALARPRDRPIGRIGHELADAVRKTVQRFGDMDGISLIGT